MKPNYRNHSRCMSMNDLRKTINWEILFFSNTNYFRLFPETFDQGRKNERRSKGTDKFKSGVLEEDEMR